MRISDWSSDVCSSDLEQLPGNMFVPISALKPIMADLLREGRSAKAPRPWLGLYAQEVGGHIFVSRVAPGGPADKAGVSANAIITSVGGKPVSRDRKSTRLNSSH